jgi:predicted nucleotidyltransferase
MRAIPDSMDAAIVASIDDRLSRLEVEDGVRIAWAIESGSRAWGFPSPDSDYDARFLYLRSAGAYLSPWPHRDVIETPLDKIFDVNGWDVAKALRLLVKGNGTVTEWLRSPIVYRGDPEFRDDLLRLAEQVTDRALLGRHYLHVGRRQWADAQTASLKKVFYALRPAAILRWLDVNPGRTVPPMDLPTALAECDPPDNVVAAADDLIAIKAVTREIGRGEVPLPIARFVNEQYARAEVSYENAERRDPAEAIAFSEEFFRRLVGRYT